MRGLLRVAVVLSGVTLAAAQEPAVGSSPTNQAASPAEHELTLSLPKAGVELDSPRTPVVQPTLGENGPVGEIFQTPTNSVAGNSSAETDDEVITVPFFSMEFRRETEVARAGGMSVSGTLVHLFQGARPAEVPKRLLHMINPFAPMEASPITPQVPNERRRAWASLVGWNPGVSAFPDPRTHVPSLDLFSMSASP